MPPSKKRKISRSGAKTPSRIRKTDNRRIRSDAGRLPIRFFSSLSGLASSRLRERSFLFMRSWQRDFRQHATHAAAADALDRGAVRNHELAVAFQGAAPAAVERAERCRRERDDEATAGA